MKKQIQLSFKVDKEFKNLIKNKSLIVGESISEFIRRAVKQRVIILEKEEE